MSLNNMSLLHEMSLNHTRIFVSTHGTWGWAGMGWAIPVTLDFALPFRVKPVDDNPPTADVQNRRRQVVAPRPFPGESINSAAANWQRA